MIEKGVTGRTDEWLIHEILRMKKEKNAVLLAHFYQIPQIQDIADYIGDSLFLARQASETTADIIVFAGVHFMAETAKILNPLVKVLLPDMHAGCSLADTCPPDEFRKFRARYPDHVVISYINSSAEIKAQSDVICTSSNAVDIVNSFPLDQKIIFAPDRNLGGYVNRVTGRNMVLWEGTCEVHDILTVESVIRLKRDNPDAKLIAHPECRAPILELADFVGSTSALLKYTISDPSDKFIVATETGILHQMKKNSPDKEFIIVSAEETCACNDCPYMKMNTLEKLYLCLRNEQPEIIMPEDLMEQAGKPIFKMLEISKKLHKV
ncbi:MAG: quinolinate synthase NadA [Bacteroidales bacterium]|nr:quinolinate synthase NadA [Bacteroidales bacterium]